MFGKSLFCLKFQRLNWSIIIFCFNERDNVLKVIDSAHKFLSKAKQSELIIVDDGSTDGSLEIINEASKSIDNVVLIQHGVNKGIGAALRSGYDTAKYDFVCAVPGDNQFDIDELYKVEYFSEKQFYSFYRTNMYKSWYRKVIHQLNKIFNKWLLGVIIKDVNWIKVYRKEHLEKVQYQLNSSIIESEICAKLNKLGVSAIELPSKYLPREYGVPKGGTWKTVKMAILETWDLYRVVKKFTVK